MALPASNNTYIPWGIPWNDPGDGCGPMHQKRAFDLTTCFERQRLFPALSLLFVAFALGSYVQLSASGNVYRRTGNEKLAKWIKITLLLCGTVFALVYSDPALSMFYLSTSLIVHANTKHSRRSNTVVLILYPVHIAALAISARTDILELDKPYIAFHVGAAALESLVLLVESLGPEFAAATDDKRDDPLARANIYSVWTFSWLTPLMRLGTHKYITADDLYPLPQEDETATLGKRLRDSTQKYKGLWMALFSVYGSPMVIALTLKLTQDVLSYAQPQLLRLLLRFLVQYQDDRKGRGDEDNNATVYFMHGSQPLAATPAFNFVLKTSFAQGLAIALTMFLAAMAQTVIGHQYLQMTFAVGMRVRAGLIQAIYSKSLVLSASEKNERATGEIVNLMSVDCAKLQSLCIDGLLAFSSPFQIALAFVSLYNLLGWPAFVGVAIMIIAIPVNTALAGVQKRMKTEQMKNSDQRTRAMSEMLANIKSIKLFAWEPAFIRRILSIRNDREMTMLREIGIVQVLSNALWSGIPLLVAFSSFAVAAVTGRRLTSDVVFPAISLFMLLNGPLANFGSITNAVVDAMVSVRRLASFLGAKELQKDARLVIDEEEDRSDSSTHPTLDIRQATFAWSDDSTSPPTLDGIDLAVHRGRLVGIFGRVASGKSSLLSAVIGEMVRSEGELVVRGTVAYVPQNPWVMSGTIRDNIVFSHEFDAAFYATVLDACALRPDLDILKEGEMTVVGEKGVTLSGGQRARVALARAVYARADLYLLDDVLAAVDSHVAGHIFHNVIGPNGILNTRARLLVTNSVSFASQMDHLVFMRRGIVLEQGGYVESMLRTEGELYRLITTHGRGLNLRDASGSATPRTAEETVVEEIPATEDSKPPVIAKPAALVRSKLQPNPLTSSVTTSTKERSEVGRVKPAVYLAYMRAASVPGFISFILLVLLAQAASISANITLMKWDDARVGLFIGIYGMCVALGALSGALSGYMLWVLCTLKSARMLHDGMLEAVMKAPLGFFEVTPTGRIMNLFSRDIFVIDQVLARVIQSFVRTLVNVLGIVGVISFNFPLFLLALPPLFYIYNRVMLYYLSTSRELKRLDATTRSPIFAWFSESLGGLSTIRAFSGQVTIFTRKLELLVDANLECYILSVGVNRWLAVRLEVLGSGVILLASLMALGSLWINSTIDAGVVGLVLSYGLNTTSSLNWVVRSASDVETNIVSVERILAYKDDVKPEKAAVLQSDFRLRDEGWPSEGRVEFRDYSVRYRQDLDLVLKNISLDIKPREKLGIVGRTGAGKSSLLLALFRIIEPSQGTIFLDGLDISTVGLHTLRSAISIIPQEPQLFEGTLRENVDPTGVFGDVEIWKALEQAHLVDIDGGLGLDAKINEGGSSLSSGQRQLLCFARALLRKSKVLVLDEATSAVDLESDQAIQTILHGETFKDVTILTIAHRLNTVMDSDRVLVLDNGEIAELDTPKALLANKQSAFYGLAAEAGLVDVNLEEE